MTELQRKQWKTTQICVLFLLFYEPIENNPKNIEQKNIHDCSVIFIEKLNGILGQIQCKLKIGTTNNLLI